MILYLKTKWGSHFHRHWFINLRGNVHVTPEAAEVMVGFLTFNPAVEAVKIHAISLDTERNLFTLGTTGIQYV